MKDQLRKFLLSLLNATLLLAIVLTGCAIFLVYKVENVAGDLITQASTSVMRQAGQDVDRALAAFVAADWIRYFGPAVF